MSADAQARSAYDKLPLSFVPNRGQVDPEVRYHAQAAGAGFFLTGDKAVVALTKGNRGTALELRFVGADPHARLEPGRRGSSTVNYLKGSEHQTGLSTYGEVTYRDLWPGIDMVFRGQGGKLKYEFHVAAGADPSRIKLRYAGADGLSLTRAGGLSIATPVGPLQDSPPASYQRIGDKRVVVGSRYVLHGGGGYAFALATHDATRPLVIDPGLEYSTLLGSTGADIVEGIAVDDTGSAYVTGYTSGSDFPATPGAFDPTHNDFRDMFVSKFSPTGPPLAYSTFIGGTNLDVANGIDVDASGNAYITGATSSSDFPVTAGVADSVYEGNREAVVTKLGPTGSALSYSTYLGGNFADDARGITVDAAGSAYVTGRTFSTDFPTTDGAFDRTDRDYEDAFATKLSPDGSAFAYSTYLGGNDVDEGEAVALDGSGGVYVTGATYSTDFPTTPGAFDSTLDARDAFITRLNPAGSALVASTYFGGAGIEHAFDIAVDQTGSPYISGQVGNAAGWVAKLDPSLSATIYRSDLQPLTPAAAIAVDATGAAYVTGSAGTIPVTPDAYDTTPNGGADAYVMRLSPDGAAVTYATWLGGNQTDRGADIALDAAGGIYVGGFTGSLDFPTTPGALASKREGFVAKLRPPQGFPRPKSAPRLEVPLVPSFIPCAEPNSNHGPPLAHPSCNPPLQASGELTLGTPDSNGLPAGGSGIARYLALPGNPATPADEADVQINFALHDVHNRFVLTEYTGNVRLVSPLRITDKSEIPGTTVTDTPLNMDVGCAATADPGRGSSCVLVTTVEAVLPGAVPEGKRSVWELGQLRVDDGGPDGDVDTAGDNSPFLVQGVFVP